MVAKKTVFKSGWTYLLTTIFIILDYINGGLEGVSRSEWGYTLGILIGYVLIAALIIKIIKYIKGVKK